MRRGINFTRILIVPALLISVAGAEAATAVPVFRHVDRNPEKEDIVKSVEIADSLETQEIEDLIVRVRSLQEILDETPLPEGTPALADKFLGPWIFSGYRHLMKRDFKADLMSRSLQELYKLGALSDTTDFKREKEIILAEDIPAAPETFTIEDMSVVSGDVTPDWLRYALRANRIQEDMMYLIMIEQPSTIEYAYWDLPVPPRLPDDDVSYVGYVKSLNLPQVDLSKAVITEIDGGKRHWLHVFNTGLQFSQAYLSKNWYQGGSDYLALLFNFYWDVQLNPVYHPNLLFQSTLSYKLGLNSQNDDEYHKYSVSQDQFQYNAKLGLKAFRNWYYTVSTQFKTQLLNSYPHNSQVQNSSFLSPGDLNFGIGMTFTKTNSSKTMQFNASIAPLSYNLKMCIDPMVNHLQYNVPQDRKFNSEVGSNADVTFTWQIGNNINYKTRLFLFTDYSYFQGDWENTLNFQFSRFFSTQIYFDLRYDSSVDPNIAPRWNKWMLKEILSVGLSYTFSTKL